MSAEPNGVSEETRRAAELSDPELWLRYFELGGMSSPAEVVSFLSRGVVPTPHDHDVLAQALNERFSDLHPEGASPVVSEVGGTRTARDVKRTAVMGRTAAGSATRANMHVRVLGSFGVLVDEAPVRLPLNAQRLVCFLALNGGTLLRQHVAGSLWGDASEQRAAGSLRSALWRLGHPAHPLVEVARAHLKLSPDVSVDIDASEALARRALDDSQDLSEVDLDFLLLSADLMPDWTEDWVLVRRESHTQLRLRALESLCRRLSEMKRFGQAAQAGMLAVSIEPLRESAQQALITAHLTQGNVAAAVKQYDSFRELLHFELKMEPSVQLQTLMKGLNR